MISTCVSPSKYQGLPWESWTKALGCTAPFEDKPPPTNQLDKNNARVMKLPKHDMKIFGLCPEQDKFTVVVCETCKMVVKPQCLLQHYEFRHTNKEPPPTAQLVTEEAVPVKTSVKVMKSMVKNPSAKVKTKKTLSKDGCKSKDGVVNPTPSLPVSLSLEAGMSISDPNSKGDPCVVSVAGAGNKTPVKARRPPRKSVPIKEREYDPDKHCGVVIAETLKPCTWSLTCKSHTMSLRRAVTGRSKPFDQLLADHRQAKEALLKQKKNLELQNSSVMLTPPSSQPNSGGEQKKQVSLSPRLTLVMNSTSTLLVNSIKGLNGFSIKSRAPPPTTVPLRLPALKLDVTPKKPVYLSATPPRLLLSKPFPPALTVPLNPLSGAATTTPTTTTALTTSTPTNTAATGASLASHSEVSSFSCNTPKPLHVPYFSLHKTCGLLYTNRGMKIARQCLETTLNRAGQGIYISTMRPTPTDERHLMLPPPPPSLPSSLSNVLNKISSKASQQNNKGTKRNKHDKQKKSNKKMSLEAASLLNIQINNLKSVLSRQYPSQTSHLPMSSLPNPAFHIPNILSNALKRSAESKPKTQNKKQKKKNTSVPPIISSMLANHSLNGLKPNKSNIPSYVRVAIANANKPGKAEPESRTLGLCESPKFPNTNKMLTETDLKKVGLRLEIFD